MYIARQIVAIIPQSFHVFIQDCGTVLTLSLPKMLMFFLYIFILREKLLKITRTYFGFCKLSTFSDIVEC